MKIAFLTTDNREQQNKYDLPSPFFGMAPAALIEGFRQLGNEVELHIISCSKITMPAPKKLAENIWFHQPVVPHLGWGRTLFLGCARAVRKLLKEIQPDLVHGQGTERDCSVSAVLSGYPNVITLHGIMRAVARSVQAKRLSYYGMASALEVFAIHRTAGVFCNSAYTESMVKDIAKKTWRVPNCIRPEFFSPLPPEESRQNTIVVLGSIISYKQSVEILKMWANIAIKHKHVTLAFIGHGGRGSDYGDEFFELLEAPLHTGRVMHINWLDINDLIEFLDSARGMIHFPTEESFGLAVAEGLARNLKLFAARTGGVPDVAEGCDGVEFFSPADWQGLSTSVGNWINDGLAVVNSTTMIQNRFSPLAIAREHLRIYETLVTA
jgi:glycosyltransferase involved in cell wall biosynthesis